MTPPGDCGYSHLAHANDLEPSVGHRTLRERCPVHLEADHDPPFHVISRHDDVIGVLKAPERWRNGDGPGVFFQESGTLGSTDDPDHARHRAALRPAFLPSAIARMEPRVAALCDELWDEAFGADGEGDFVASFAFPFPAAVIAELLGVPVADRDRFGEWSHHIVEGLGGGDLDAYDRATRAIWAYIGDLLDERLARDADDADDEVDGPDVIDVLASAHRRGALDRHEVERLGHQLLVAGHETTTSLLGLALYRLIERPGLRSLLAERPDLLDAAVEELLRFDSPVQGLFRTSPDPVELHDTTIPAGTKVQVLYAAANRDPARWDHPDELRFDRDVRQQRQHLAFGWGVHYCIGAPLARLQARHALRRISRGFATVELADHPTLTPPFFLRGLATLPIRWTVPTESETTPT